MLDPLTTVLPSTLTPVENGNIILYEYRHQCGAQNHQLLLKVTRRGLELVCPRCRTEQRERSRITITWSEVLAMMLMAMRNP